MGNGRTIEQFRNSLKGVRDRFDAHVPESGRVGWRLDGGGPDSPPRPLSPVEESVLAEWAARSCDDIWLAIKHLAADVAEGAVAFDGQWDELRAFLQERPRWESLGQRLRDTVEGLGPDRISFTNANGNAELATKERLRRLWVAAATNSFLPYYNGRHRTIGTARGRIEVPTGIAREPGDDPQPPGREAAERLFDLRQWTALPRGGHFAAMEVPHLLSEDIASFFRPLR
jgi:pimeloyl-ACP methyl ester carboxylesterase